MNSILRMAGAVGLGLVALSEAHHVIADVVTIVKSAPDLQNPAAPGHEAAVIQAQDLAPGITYEALFVGGLLTLMLRRPKAMTVEGEAKPA